MKRETATPARAPDGQDGSNKQLAPPYGEEPADDEDLEDLWSIGIYAGTSPLSMVPHPEVLNPVLTAEDVSDIPARFVADPFMAIEKGAWYMFFEVLNSETGLGEIGLATSRDGLRWKYRRIVLQEEFHLSYPYVFKRGNQYYMIPETIGAESIVLYKATKFPTKWSRQAELVPGIYADPSIFRYDGKWWMFACPRPSFHDTLRLYYSDRLTHGWREHCQSPILRGNDRTARPAGRVTMWRGKLIRFAQDCFPNYGSRVRAFEITELTPTSYSETEVVESPILSGGGAAWNLCGMHNIDPHPLGRKWLACVDGWRQVSNSAAM